MTGASVSWVESNASVGQNQAITQSNWGSSLTHHLVTADHPITANTASYEKWQRFLVTINDAVKVHNFRVYASSISLPTGCSLYTAASVGGTPVQTWVAPSTVAAGNCTVAMLETVPASANVGIDNSMSGSLTANGTSDWFVHQMITGSTATVGAANFVLTVLYDEVN